MIGINQFSTLDCVRAIWQGSGFVLVELRTRCIACSHDGNGSVFLARSKDGGGALKQNTTSHTEWSTAASSAERLFYPWTEDTAPRLQPQSPVQNQLQLYLYVLQQLTILSGAPAFSLMRKHARATIMSFARKIRRAAERQAAKQARKEAKSNPLDQHTTPEPNASSDAEPQTRLAPDGLPYAPSRPANGHTFSDEELNQLGNRASAKYLRDHPFTDRNRANAQHSTGPRTLEGKAASSKNSLQHGIYSRQPENRQHIEHHFRLFAQEHKPGSETETLLVSEMAEHWVRLHRYRSIEADLLSKESFLISQMTAVHKFMNAAERSFYKALTTLRSLQAERRKAEQLASNAATATPKTDTAGFVPPKSKMAASPNGFVPPFTPSTAKELEEQPSETAANAA